MADATETTEPPLTNREKKAWREARELDARGGTVGTRKIVSMQALAQRGIVTPVHGKTGLIEDWKLTGKGREGHVG